jgi:integrase
MRSTTVPKYRRNKASNRAFVQIKGRRHYLGKWDSPDSRERYGRLVAEMAVSPAAAEKLTPLTPAATQLTVVELCDAYHEFARGYYVKNGQPSNWLYHIRLVLGKLRDLYGRTPAADFGPLAMKAIRQTMIDAGNSRPYVNKVVAIIPRVFKWGAAEQLVPASIYSALRTVEGLRKGRTPAREPAPVKPVSAAVVDMTLPHCPAVVADMIRFQRFTGCRPGEVCQLRPLDLDRSGEVWTYRPESHKTEHHGRERIIFIGPKAQTVLLSYLLRPADARCFSPLESEAKRLGALHAKRRTPLRYGNRPGTNRKPRPKRRPQTAYTKDSYGRALARAIEKGNAAITKAATAAGIDQPQVIPHWHLNQLRHSAATEIRRSYGLEAAQVILGHSKADVTQVYAERDYDLGADVARKIG